MRQAAAHRKVPTAHRKVPTAHRKVMRHPFALTAAAFAIVAFASCIGPPVAGGSVQGDACSAASDVNGLAGKACSLLGSSGKIVSAGKKLVSGHVGGAIKSLLAGGGSASSASTALGLTAIVAWVVAGAKFSLTEMTKVLGATTTPQLRTSWFSATYWRIAGIAAVLTLPFLFAAAAQALIRSDLALLARAALGYLPLAMIAVGLAAPLTMLLLAATDQLCAAVSAAGGGGLHPDISHLFATGALLVKAPFLVFLVGAVTSSAALALWLELATREAAVYVIVLMLPLAFAAFVWPSRRVWAVRAVELLVALILSKFAIVAVLVLGGSALDRLGHFGLDQVTEGLAGTVLVLLATLSPWAVLRLLPMSEVAGAALGSLRPGLSGEVGKASQGPLGGGDKIAELAEAITSHMTRQAREASGSEDDDADGQPRNGRAAADAYGAGAGPTDSLRPLAPANGAAASENHAAGTNSAAPDANRAQTPNGAAAPTQDEGQRIPGLPPIFQASDLAWRPIPFGADGDWDVPLWPMGDEREPPDREPQPPWNGSRDAEPRVDGDDHDPLPPRQESEEGRL